MNTNLFLIVTGLLLIIGIILVKRIGVASAAAARKMLGEGAPVIDVRTENEFSTEHLPNSINIPLDQISDRISSAAPDKNAPLLLHCLSGSRSAVARSVLKQMGYTRAYNLGSITRARRILSDG